MRKLLLATTVDDHSLPLFLTRRVSGKIRVFPVFFHEDPEEIRETIGDGGFDYVYIRDPFNGDVYDLSDISGKVALILEGTRGAFVLDGLRSFDDLLFEDKWRQYGILGEFMPKTEILSDVSELEGGDRIAKKRISSRARGIAFTPREICGSEISGYVVQEMLPLEKEYRVYVVFGRIMGKATVKSPKRHDAKVKIIGSEAVSEDLVSFIRPILEKIPFDFVGLDIGWDGNRFWLLEANRSCLFNGYFRETGVNLAEVLFDGLPSVETGASLPNPVS